MDNVPIKKIKKKSLSGTSMKQAISASSILRTCQRVPACTVRAVDPSMTAARHGAEVRGGPCES
jgi:hypothetical protein